jgi:methionyl-tRNA formyltransferase
VRVVFAGSPEPAARILRDLAGGRHEVALVVSQPDRRRGRAGRPSPTPVALAAEALGIPCVRPPSINDPAVLDRMREARAGALVVVAFGQLLKEPILSEWECINVHFSILPAYRGAAPVERALMDGVTETGVSIMRMEAGLDTGPVAEVVTTPVAPGDDAGAVLDRLCALSPPALLRALDAVEAGSFDPRPQPAEGVSLAPKITEEDRVLDPSGTARALADRVRALSPHIGARLVVDGQPFKVWRAAPADGPPGGGLRAQDGRLLLGCADRPLEILELQPPSRGRQPAAGFLRGWRGALTLG